MTTNDPNRARATPDSNPANRDPITGAPGAHPVGTGLGAAAGGFTGAAVGAAAAGPIGAAVGAAAGAVAGGLGGKAAAEAMDPTVQDAYWQKTYPTRPYASSAIEYKDIRPAYRYGWESAARADGKSFEDWAPALERNWESAKSDSSLTWDKAKSAVRDAWDRVAGTKR